MWIFCLEFHLGVLQSTICRWRTDGTQSLGRRNIAKCGAHWIRRFHKELLELGNDVLAIRVLLQRIAVWSNLVHESLALRRLGHVNHLLHDIVGVLVLHHDLQCTESVI